MMLHNKIADVTTGQLIEVLATDPSTERDIPKFCNFLGHELVSQEQQDNEYVYLIRKGS
jgi:tRNA 2-thiouridine synthesizing protein A